jgi:hypothetical protein
MTVIVENRHSAGFIVSEDEPGRRSRDEITLAQQSSKPTQSGTVLGKYSVSAAAPVYAAAAGNTGNFTSSAVVESSGAQVGAYRIEFIAATVFTVYDPTGNFLGEGNLGTAFSAGGVSFTLTAGATAAVAGDNATITVSAHASAGLYAPLDLTATTGIETPAAILFNTLDATGGNTPATAIVRAAEVNGSELIYPTGATVNQKTAINAQLASLLGIIVR